jgi:kynurenine formamidase
MKIIDISHPHSERLAPWPGDTPFDLRFVPRHVGQDRVFLGRLRMAESLQRLPLPDFLR